MTHDVRSTHRDGVDRPVPPGSVEELGRTLSGPDITVTLLAAPLRSSRNQARAGFGARVSGVVTT